jgi:pyruvate formate lyase activating enzyme
MSGNRGQVFNVQRFSVNDGPGIRTTVFFRGCPLSCTWCHNPESWRVPVSGEDVTVDSIMDIIKRDVMFYEESGGGVTFSGGEPLEQPDFLLLLLKACRKLDINTAVDTSGYANFDFFNKILPFTDLFLFDLKIIDDHLHLHHTGVSNKIIHENLFNLSSKGKKIFIRIPLIPGITDTDENINSIIELLSSVKTIHHVSLLPFNEISKSKYKKLNINNELASMQTQTEQELNELSSTFASAGYEVSLRG